MKKLITLVTLLIAGLSFSAYSYETNQEIVERCKVKYGSAGPSVVKYCADNDIEAREKLSLYDSKYKAFIERCKRKYGSAGASVVKYCVDNDIEADNALKKY